DYATSAVVLRGPLRATPSVLTLRTGLNHERLQRNLIGRCRTCWWDYRCLCADEGGRGCRHLQPIEGRASASGPVRDRRVIDYRTSSTGASRQRVTHCRRG